MSGDKKKRRVRDTLRNMLSRSSPENDSEPEEPKYITSDEIANPNGADERAAEAEREIFGEGDSGKYITKDEVVTIGAEVSVESPKERKKREDREAKQKERDREAGNFLQQMKARRGAETPGPQVPPPIPEPTIKPVETLPPPVPVPPNLDDPLPEGTTIPLVSPAVAASLPEAVIEPSEETPTIPEMPLGPLPEATIEPLEDLVDNSARVEVAAPESEVDLRYRVIFISPLVQNEESEKDGPPSNPVVVRLQEELKAKDYIHPAYDSIEDALRVAQQPGTIGMFVELKDEVMTDTFLAVVQLISTYEKQTPPFLIYFHAEDKDIIMKHGAQVAKLMGEYPDNVLVDKSDKLYDSETVKLLLAGTLPGHKWEGNRPDIVDDMVTHVDDADGFQRYQQLLRDIQPTTNKLNEVMSQYLSENMVKVEGSWPAISQDSIYQWSVMENLPSDRKSRAQCEFVQVTEAQEGKYDKIGFYVDSEFVGENLGGALIVLECELRKMKARVDG